MVLEYNVSTWQDLVGAYDRQGMVYVKVPVNADETRIAHLSYFTDSTSLKRAEFLYYRSVGKSTNLKDEVRLYRLTPSGWSSEIRPLYQETFSGRTLDPTDPADAAEVLGTVIQMLGGSVPSGT